MDFQFYEPNNPYQQPMFDKRSRTMTSAALALGITSLVSCMILYISIPCGALAIIFALLSKGGEMTMSREAKRAFRLGALGIIITAVMYGITLAVIIDTYGSLEAYLRVYLQDYGMTLEELMNGVY